jgi:2-dehydro-3-deoxyphosphogluconate aldolase/(4S)-4-hydroxy-2-oxoglutarate aldolase
MDATNLLNGFRLVPVVVLEDANNAVPLARTLLESGIGVMEITLRTVDGLRSIEQVARDVPEMIVGAGSVRTVEHFADVSAAGAKFAVSPGASAALCNAAAEHNLPFVPGAATASEMIVLLERGYRLQKFFPAGASGGIDFLKSVSSPIPEVKFMPTGGISTSNAADYLALSNVSGVGGSWITPKGLLVKKDFAAIAELASDALRFCA